MVVIEKTEMSLKHDALKKEAEFIKSHGGTLNTQIYSRLDVICDSSYESFKEFPSYSTAENPEFFSKTPDATAATDVGSNPALTIDYKDVIPNDLMPLFSGITGLDENYEQTVSPNADEEYGLAKIIAKKYCSGLVCSNINKNVWYIFKDSENDETDEYKHVGWIIDDARLNIYKWSLYDSVKPMRTLISTTFYEYIKSIAVLLKTNYIDKYDNNTLNKYRIPMIISQILKITNRLYTTTFVNKILFELRVLLYRENFIENMKDIRESYIVKEFFSDHIKICEEGCAFECSIIELYREWFEKCYGKTRKNNSEILIQELNKISKKKDFVYEGIAITG